VTTVTENGGRLDWSKRLNLIAFDRRQEGGYFDVYTMNPDGSNQICLTCGKKELPARSKGNPVWHPTGDFIVFQAQNSFRGLGAITDYFANPGAGVNNDLWVMDRGGRRFWQLTDLKPRIGGVLHPQFSRNGDKLFWAERVDAKPPTGTWSLRVADFVVENGNPRKQNEQVLQPGAQKGFYEAHDFSPDGRQVLFSGNLEKGQAAGHGDIYLYNLATRELKNLTQSPEEWDEHAHFSPDGRTIVWMTSKDLPGKVRAAALRTDYWLMDVDGQNKRRLTYFNTPGHPEYIESGVAAADSSWSPDGSRIAAYLISDVRKGGSIVMIDLPANR
jgi:Tol biopolymer transport system component